MGDVWRLRNRDEESAAKVKVSLGTAADALTQDFYAGAEPGFADYALWPAFERLEVKRTGLGCGRGEGKWGQVAAAASEGALSLAAHPKLAAYAERMKVHKRPNGEFGSWIGKLARPDRRWHSRTANRRSTSASSRPSPMVTLAYCWGQVRMQDHCRDPGLRLRNSRCIDKSGIVSMLFVEYAI